MMCNRMQMDIGKMPLSIYLDLSKAFDTLDHNILLSKPDHYGITDLANSLFKSYLIDRNQHDYFNDTESDREHLTTGFAPFLGPLLFFNIY